MDFSDLIKKRCSTRAYINKKIDAGALDKILQACVLAPSAGNLQSYRIFAVQNLEIKKKLAHAALDQDFIADAAVALVFFANPQESAQKYSERGELLYCIQDATIAAAYAQLAAVDLGLDTVWVGAFDPAEVSAVCGAGPELIPVAVIPVGFGNPVCEKRPFKRKNLNDLAIFL